MEINIRSNIKEVVKGMSGIKKQIPFATSKALNRTAYKLWSVFPAEIEKQIDRPIPFTKKAMAYRKSTKRNLTATVYAKAIQEKYLSIQETGGTRTPKGKALPIPIGQRKNRYGNMPRTALKTMRGNKGKYFSGSPHGRTPGIYQRTGKGGRGGLKLMVKWQTSASYSAKTDFSGFAERIVRANFDREMRSAIAYAVRTAR